MVSEAEKKVIAFFNDIYPLFLESQQKMQATNKESRLIVVSDLCAKNLIFSVWGNVFAVGTFLENIFFIKPQYYVNNLKGQFLFTRALLCTILLVLFLSFLFKVIECSFGIKPTCVELEKYLAYLLAVFGAFYWNARKSFSDKWNYSANLYNKINFDLPFLKYKNSGEKVIAIKYANACLSIDLLRIGMWSHDSFNPGFKENLEIAVWFKNFSMDYETGFLNIGSIKVRSENKIKEIYRTQNLRSDIADYVTEFHNTLSDYIGNQSMN